MIYYHGSPTNTIKRLRAGSYISPSKEIAELMGRFHKDTGKVWQDSDLAEQHKFGKPIQWAPGREPEGVPTLYNMVISDPRTIDTLDNPYEHKIINARKVTRMLKKQANFRGYSTASHNQILPKVMTQPTKQEAFTKLQDALEKVARARSPDQLVSASIRNLGKASNNLTKVDRGKISSPLANLRSARINRAGSLINKQVEAHLGGGGEIASKIGKAGSSMGKSLAIGAGVVGAGILASKLLSKPKPAPAPVPQNADVRTKVAAALEKVADRMRNGVAWSIPKFDPKLDKRYRGMEGASTLHHMDYYHAAATGNNLERRADRVKNLLVHPDDLEAAQQSKKEMRHLLNSGIIFNRNQIAIVPIGE